MAIEKLPSTGDAPRATGVPASLVAGGAADSAGYPWAGRTFAHHDTAFADDDGSASAELQHAVKRLRECAHEFMQRGSQQPELLAALARAQADALMTLSTQRVLVPLLAEAGDIGMTPEGRTVEKTQELSIVTVAAPDGRRVMPVFSSAATMRTWNPAARPIPVPAPQAAVAAASERTDLIIIDAGTIDSELGVRRTQLEPVALAQRIEVPWNDAAVVQAFRDSVHDVDEVLSIDVLPGDPEMRLLAPETDVVLHLLPGLQKDQLNAIVGLVQQRWAEKSVIAQRVDSMRVMLREQSAPQKKFNSTI
ncbi:MAG: SseB family protein [Leucobacter sp.]|nr:SseB family protein [Leucobacter sp.]